MTFNEIMQKKGKRITPKVYYYQNDIKINVIQNDFIQNKVYFNASLVGTIMQSMELELKVQLPDTAIYFEIDAKYNTDTATKTYGPYYRQEEPTYNADSKTYIHNLSDAFVKTMVDYKAITINYPTTVYDFFLRLCTACGLTTNIESLPNGTRNMTYDPYTGINFTYRDAFDDISQATGTAFKLNGTEIEKSNLGTTEIVINDDILKNQNISFGQHYGPINSIVLSRGSGADNVYKRDESLTSWNEFKIKDNQLMNNNDRSDYLNELYNALHGIEYDIFDTELVGYGGFEPFAKVKFSTIKNKTTYTYNSYVFNNEQTITQGYTESIYTHFPEETTTDYKTASKTDKLINITNLKVDKQAGEIQALSKKIVDISTTTNGTNSVSIVNAHQDKIHYLKLTGNISIPITCDGSNGTNSLMSGQTKSGVSKSRSSSTYCNGLVVSNDLVVNDFILNIVQNKEIYSQFVLPINYLNSYGTTFDEFTYEDGECFITRKVGINNNGSKYILKNPIKEDLGALKIILPSGSSTLEFPSLSGIKIEITYLTENDYTTTFATQVDVESQIKVASDEVLIESKSQILDGGDEIIASINTTSTGKVKIKASDTIEIEGLTTVGDKIIFNPDGSITAQDLRLLDGGKVIGGEGILTSLIINSSGKGKIVNATGDFNPLGLDNTYNDENGYYTAKNRLVFNFNIPKGFTISSAYIYMEHIPMQWYYTGTYYNTGYSRNLKLYKGSNFSSMYRTFDLAYGNEVDASCTYTEISNAFGSSGFTGSSTGLTYATSIDIKNYIDASLTEDKLNLLKIETSMTPGVYSSYPEVYQYTGGVLATLVIMGYSTSTG